MQHLAAPLLGVGNHRVELVHSKGAAVKAAPHLAEDDRPVHALACEP
jgi:hypothetical protein